MWCEEGGIEMLRYTAWSGQEICARNPFSVMQVNIKPPKGSWEGVISSKQRIHYHHQKVMWAAGVTRHQKCLFQNFLFETDGMSLKWKGKKKQVIPQTSNIFFQPTPALMATSRTGHHGLPSNNTVEGYHELILNEMPLGPHSEFLMLRMLALDTKNLGVPKVSNTEFAYDIDLRTKGDLLIFPTLS